MQKSPHEVCILHLTGNLVVEVLCVSKSTSSRMSYSASKNPPERNLSSKDVALSCDFHPGWLWTKRGTTVKERETFYYLLYDG